MREAASQETAPRATQSHSRGWDPGLLYQKVTIITSTFKLSQITEQQARKQPQEPYKATQGAETWDCSAKNSVKHQQNHNMNTKNAAASQETAPRTTQSLSRGWDPGPLNQKVITIC